MPPGGGRVRTRPTSGRRTRNCSHRCSRSPPKSCKLAYGCIGTPWGSGPSTPGLPLRHLPCRPTFWSPLGLCRRRTRPSLCRPRRAVGGAAATKVRGSPRLRQSSVGARVALPSYDRHIRSARCGAPSPATPRAAPGRSPATGPGPAPSGCPRPAPAAPGTATVPAPAAASCIPLAPADTGRGDRAGRGPAAASATR